MGAPLIMACDKSSRIFFFFFDSPFISSSLFPRFVGFFPPSFFSVSKRNKQDQRHYILIIHLDLRPLFLFVSYFSRVQKKKSCRMNYSSANDLLGRLRFTVLRWGYRWWEYSRRTCLLLPNRLIIGNRRKKTERRLESTKPQQQQVSSRLGSGKGKEKMPLRSLWWRGS